MLPHLPRLGKHALEAMPNRRAEPVRPRPSHRCPSCLPRPLAAVVMVVVLRSRRVVVVPAIVPHVGYMPCMVVVPAAGGGNGGKHGNGRALDDVLHIHGMQVLIWWFMPLCRRPSSTRRARNGFLFCFLSVLEINLFFRASLASLQCAHVRRIFLTSARLEARMATVWKLFSFSSVRRSPSACMRAWINPSPVRRLAAPSSERTVCRGT